MLILKINLGEKVDTNTEFLGEFISGLNRCHCEALTIMKTTDTN